MKKKKKKIGNIPLTFRPILWGLKWSAIDIQEDKQDIIVHTINEGNMQQWRWITDTYGKSIIKSVLEKRLATEFHPESRNLARVLFGVKNFQHTYARKSAHTTRGAIAPRLVYKDYVDWYFLLKEEHVTIEKTIAFAEKKFGKDFNDRLFLGQLVSCSDVPFQKIDFVGDSVPRSTIEKFLNRAVQKLKQGEESSIQKTNQELKKRFEE